MRGFGETVNTQVMPSDYVDPTQPLSDTTKEEVARQMADLSAKGFVKLKTEYIIVGDEPRTQKGVINIKSSLKKEDYDNLVKYLTFMPRSLLWDFFMKKIWPNLPWDMYTPACPGDNNGMAGLDVRKRTSFVLGMKAPQSMGAGGVNFAFPYVTSIYGDKHQKKDYEDMVWAAFIDVFNEANLKHINENGMDPWEWEAIKLDAYYVSSSKEAIQELDNQLNAYGAVSLALDPEAKKIMEAYSKLPKLGDLGMEINRQNAVKELLKRQDYKTAQAIVDAYRYLSETDIGQELTKPIPYNIVSQSGETIAKATKQGV